MIQLWNFEFFTKCNVGRFSIKIFFSNKKFYQLLFLSLHKISFFLSDTFILAEVTHVYAYIHIAKFHNCQWSRFTVMVVQSFKKCKFFNKNYCENFSKKLKKKFSSGFLSWENKIISNFLDPPLWRPFLKNFRWFFRLRFDWKICIFWNFGPP